MLEMISMYESSCMIEVNADETVGFSLDTLRAS